MDLRSRCIHALLKHSDDFERAILATLRAGGDNAGRASTLGAWLGAHLGIAAIPKNWTVKLNRADRISEALEKILPASLTTLRDRERAGSS
ncbi:MAG: ADP-ribosylglycohydrolase family protein [Verrucomicrobia bacterium]|nr:ADP-ribosylglycohydrolase family protein [Verrucomicrobiota bacterium]MBV9297418.1 ADP-ribosylglycohydrolase family protein [Verrucomicrobiota bacterium]